MPLSAVSRFRWTPKHIFLGLASLLRRLPFPRGLKAVVRARLLPESECAALSVQSDLARRRAHVLRHIHPARQTGLELGPLAAPLVTRAEAPQKVWYVDHLSTQELREHYASDPNVRVSEIVEIDYVWRTHPLMDVVGNRLFDYVIACHVIEHVPDMLGWLSEVSDVLVDRGILALVIPDKRFTFDIARELTTMGMLLEAHMLHRSRPSPREVFDHVAMARKVGASEAWSENLDLAKLEPYHELHLAMEIARSAFETDQYHDVHVSVFTPASLLELLEMMARLELLDFLVADMDDTARGTLEFYLTLERLPRDVDRRAALELQLESIVRARASLGNLVESRSATHRTGSPSALRVPGGK